MLAAVKLKGVGLAVCDSTGVVNLNGDVSVPQYALKKKEPVSSCSSGKTLVDVLRMVATSMWLTNHGWIQSSKAYDACLRLRYR